MDVSISSFLLAIVNSFIVILVSHSFFLLALIIPTINIITTKVLDGI